MRKKSPERRAMEGDMSGEAYIAVTNEILKREGHFEQHTPELNQKISEAQLRVRAKRKAERR